MKKDSQAGFIPGGEGEFPLRLLIISNCQDLFARRFVDIEIENGGRSASRGASEPSKV